MGVAAKRGELRMPSAEEYRRYAAECIALVQQAQTAEQKARLLEIAEAWRGLADKIERSASLKCNESQE